MSKNKKWYDNTLLTQARAIEALTKNLDYDVLDKIVERLLKLKDEGGKVVTMGCGTSGTAARRVAHMLNCIEVPSIFLSPADAPHGALGFVQNGDVVVMFAKGGNTSEICSLIPSCKKKGATIVGVTNNEGSMLAKNADILMVLETGEEPDQWHLLPCASTLCAVAAWDAIVHTTLRLSSYTMKDFYVIHPGGATGEALLKNIDNRTNS